MNEFKSAAHPLRVMELFAGVGGFRHGLQAVKNAQDGPCFEVAWSNQFEPGCKKQHAAQVYKARWGVTGFVNRDIFEVLEDEAAMADIDALAPNMLVGGFPCQDYSVAKPSSQSEGLDGKKGVLWWAIHRMLETRLNAGTPIQYLLLENVDRLINSPTVCRGRDFAIILSSLQSLGYAVEWRVVNSADYGFPQRRKRIFIVAYHASTPAYRDLQAANSEFWLTDVGTLAQALPAALKSNAVLNNFDLPAEVLAAQDGYATDKCKTRFKSAGVCIGGQVWTGDVRAALISDFSRFVGQCTPMTLGDVVGATGPVPEAYFIDETRLPRWQYLKGAKSIERVSAAGFEYTFAEGALAFPDALHKPSRTIITSEGGAAASRTKHVVRDAQGRLRRLVPEELEALTGFPRGFTDGSGLTDVRRAFLMGNALVTGLVGLIGAALHERHSAACHESAKGSMVLKQP